MSPALDLTLPEPERRRARGLARAWRDLLYVPGPGFATSLEPGAYRSTLFVVPVDGPALRISSFVVPAFGSELCRIRLESVSTYRADALGSFFEPSRRGLVYAMSGDRRAGAARAPDQPGWCYEGASLRPLLEEVTQVRCLRERVTGARSCSWMADRGLVLTGADGAEVLLLAGGDAEEPTLMPAPRLHRALLDPTAPAVPGATTRDLLGYGEWEGALDLDVRLEPC